MVLQNTHSHSYLSVWSRRKPKLSHHAGASGLRECFLDSSLSMM